MNDPLPPVTACDYCGHKPHLPERCAKCKCGEHAEQMWPKKKA